MTLLMHRGAPVLPPGVTRHALLYPLRPGTGAAADAVFTGGGDPPPQAGTTRLLSTTVFRHEDTVVRQFEIVGDLDEAIEHLVRATALQNTGQRLGQHLEHRHLRRGRAAALLPRAADDRRHRPARRGAGGVRWRRSASSVSAPWATAWPSA